MRQIKLPDANLALQRVQDDRLRERGITLSVLRLDLIHPFVSGNKWFKLRPYLEQARAIGCKRVLSFGGAFSNHLLALAAAGREFGFATIGIVRGELMQPLNPVLQAAQDFGMTLLPLSRTAYREKDTPEFLNSLAVQWGDVLVIPEGGASLAGVLGSMTIADGLRWQAPPGCARIVTLASATGTTLAGVVAAMGEDVQVDATLVLKGEDRVSAQVSQWLSQLAASGQGTCAARWQVLQGWHCGGYARYTSELVEFIEEFSSRTSIPLEPVYTGKMLWSVYKRIASGEIPEGAEVIAIHTGGILPRSD